MKLYHGSSTMFEKFDLNMAGNRTSGADCPDEFINLCNLGVFCLGSMDGQMEMYDNGYIAEIEIDFDPEEDCAYTCHMDDMIRWMEAATIEEIIEEIGSESKIIKMDNGDEWEYILFDLSIIKGIQWDCTK